MDSQELTRRESTILSADVKDFSRLMSRNDVETVCAINRHRRLMAQQVAQHQGRVVDMAGDSFLAIDQNSGRSGDTFSRIVFQRRFDFI